MIGRNAPSRTPSRDDRAQRLEHSGHVGQRRVVEVRAAFSDLAEPDRREVPPRLGFRRKRLDEGAHFCVWRSIGGRDLANARADGAEHVAKDFAVELGFVAEVVVDHRLVEPGRVGDAIDARAGKAVRGKGGGGGGQDPVRDGSTDAAGPRRLAGRAGRRLRRLTNWSVNFTE